MRRHALCSSEGRRRSAGGPLTTCRRASLCRSGVARMPRSTTVLGGELELPSPGPMTLAGAPPAFHLPRAGGAPLAFVTRLRVVRMRTFYAVHFEALDGQPAREVDG